jgi:hypothetical protein
MIEVVLKVWTRTMFSIVGVNSAGFVNAAKPQAGFANDESSFDLTVFACLANENESSDP